jgi:alkaline phosphatase D
MSDTEDGDREACEPAGHADLLSAMDARELSCAFEPQAASDRAAFAVDPDSDPAETFPQSVARAGPTPSGVILWTRIDSAHFAPVPPIAHQAATD